MWKALWAGGAKHVSCFSELRGCQQHPAGNSCSLLLFSQPQIQHASEELCTNKATHPHLFVLPESNTADISTNFFLRQAGKRRVQRSRWPSSPVFFMNQKDSLAHTKLLSKDKLPVFPLPSTTLSSWSAVLCHFLQSTPTSQSRSF